MLDFDLGEKKRGCLKSDNRSVLGKKQNACYLTTREGAWSWSVLGTLAQTCNGSIARAPLFLVRHNRPNLLATPAAQEINLRSGQQLSAESKNNSRCAGLGRYKNPWLDAAMRWYAASSYEVYTSVVSFSSFIWELLCFKYPAGLASPVKLKELPTTAWRYNVTSQQLEQLWKHRAWARYVFSPQIDMCRVHGSTARAAARSIYSRLERKHFTTLEPPHQLENHR